MEHIYSQNSNWEVRTKLIIFSWESVLEALSLFFVELESPYGNITLKDGQLGAEFRDGISQLEDWKRWLPANYSSFGEIMRKYKNSAFDLPEEFYVLDMSRFHYVVVAGRRTDFRDKTYIIKRERKKADDIDIIHYDNLFDFSNNLIGKQTY